MAWANGTAANHRDLLGKLRDFLVTNAALVAAGQNWTVLSGPAAGTPLATDEIVFSGPGLAGDDDIRVGFKFYENAGAGFYNLGLVGLTSSGVNDIENQPGASRPVWMLLLNSAMEYWFIASGRSFRVIVRAGGNYPQCYGGFILPEHLPDDWPYPLFVGASAWERNIGNSRNDGYNSAYWNGKTEDSVPNGKATGYLCDAGRIWRAVANELYYTASSTNMIRTVQWSSQIYAQNIRQSLTNQPTIVQGLLATDSTLVGRANFGRLEGVFYLPSFAQTPEEIVTIDGDDYLGIPNIFRTNDGNYAAYSLI